MDLSNILALSIGLPIWIGSGVLAYGLTLGWFQRHYWSVRDRGDYFVAGIMFLAGTIGLLFAFLSSERGYHGFKWTASTSDWVKKCQHPRFPDHEGSG